MRLITLLGFLSFLLIAITILLKENIDSFGKKSSNYLGRILRMPFLILKLKPYSIEDGLNKTRKIAFNILLFLYYGILLAFFLVLLNNIRK